MRQGKRGPLKVGSKGGGANAPPIPARLAPFLLEPALLPGEREAEYLALVHAISAAFEPCDAVEWLWVKDVVDYTWQAEATAPQSGSHSTRCGRRADERLFPRHRNRQSSFSSSSV